MRNVFWAAGVKASPLGQSLGVPLDRAGRVIVGPDLTIPGHPRGVRRRRHGGGAVGGHRPAGAGSGAGRHPDGPLRGTDDRRARCAAVRAAVPRAPFVYQRQGFDGRSSARRRPSPRSAGWKFGGFLAWLLWGGVHIAFLIGFRNRLQVLLSWFWSWLLNARDARLITGDAQPRHPCPPRDRVRARPRRSATHGERRCRTRLILAAPRIATPSWRCERWPTRRSRAPPARRW